MDDQFDFACSRTFRERLPDLAMDYRASDTFAGPPSRRRTRLFVDQERDEWLQEISGLRSSRDEWMRRALAAEAEVDRIRARSKQPHADAVGFAGIVVADL